MVPNLFGTRDWLCGRQFFHGLGGWGDSSGSNVNDHQWLGASGRWSFTHSPTAYLLLCGPVPNRLQTGTGLRPGGWGPWSKASVSLLIFFLDDLSIDVSGVLKFPIIIVLLLISPFMSVNICIYVDEHYICFLYCSLYHYIMPFFVFYYRLCFKVYFFLIWLLLPSFLFVSICVEYVFPSPHFQSVCL